MNRRRTAVAALALFALSGCSSQRAAEADAEPAALRGTTAYARPSTAT
ncbi:hypothetical protein ACF1AB_22515 [Streptomyces sp. NPDC014846]